MGDKPLKQDALVSILRVCKSRSFLFLNSQIPDLIRTLDENDEPNRIADLVSSMLKSSIKKVSLRPYVETQ
ncbi:MAG: hypothetical protein Q9M36_04875, partial [Sulfurovum sp.]|nr:hypothetical protein [Sulfurovum sp.]